MTQRAAFKAAFLEKLGAPLLASLPVSEGGSSEAQQMAALLGQSVSLGAKLSDMLELKESDERAESIRVGLTATASGLLAAYQNKTGRAPDEAMIKRMTGALETSLTFADNFTPAAENTARLETLEAQGYAVDENQLNIQYMQAFLPVIAAVADFTFGRDEKQLVSEIAEKLQIHAKKLTDGLLGEGAAAAETKRIELMALRTLVQLYEGCHQAEMQKLVKMDEQERMKLTEESGGQLSMAPVWQSFSLRLAMLKSIAGLDDEVVSADQGQGANKPESADSPAAQAPEPQTAPPAQPAPQETAPPQPPPERQGEVAGQEETPEAASENENPMSFFAKKPAGGNTGNNENQEA